MNSPQKLAIQLAKIVQNVNIREFIKSEVSLQKDGDYDALFAELIDKEIPQSQLRSSESNLTLRDYLNQTSIATTRSANSSIEDILIDIENNYPLLQISVPNMENASWEEIISGETPFLVAYLDNNYDDMKADPIVAYDQTGTVHILDGNIPPKTPVIIISESERIFRIPVTQKEQYTCNDIVYETSDYAYLKMNFINLIDENDNSNAIDTKATGIYRADYPTYYDYIWKAQLPDKDQDYEGWAKGRPEIAVIISFYENKLPPKEIEFDDKGWANQSIKYLNSEIIRWDPSQISKYIAYYWREKDGGNDDKEVSVTIPSQNINGINMPSSTIKFKIDGSDDYIGESYVYYDDVSGRRYDPSGKNQFYFWLEIK